MDDAGGLMTPREIAQEWRVSEQAIADRIARGTFPEPVKVAGRVRLYLRDQVDAYRRDRRFMPGESVPVSGHYALVDDNGTSGGIMLVANAWQEFPPARSGYAYVLARTGEPPEALPLRPRSADWRYPVNDPRRHSHRVRS